LLDQKGPKNQGQTFGGYFFLDKKVAKKSRPTEICLLVRPWRG
jgi:hypothetical protein